MGACADMMLTPGGAVAVGSLSGILSVCGFQYIQVQRQSLLSRVYQYLYNAALPACQAEAA